MTRLPNILLIMIDTLRADHLSCYGYVHQTSPAIASLAAEGVVCDQFLANGIPTQPAEATLLTGRTPLAHGVVAHGGGTFIPADAAVLTEVLAAEGYQTIGIDEMARKRPDFSRGFQRWWPPSGPEPHAVTIPADRVGEALMDLLDASREPFFCMARYWDPHTPYLPPTSYRRLFYDGDPAAPSRPSLDELADRPMMDIWQDTWFRQLGTDVRDVDYIRGLYDGAIRFCDDSLGRVFTRLRAAGIDERTCVLIIGDHGESLTEHGIYFEHHGLFDAVVRTPMIVRYPEGGLSGGRRVAGIIEHQDLLPSLLELIGAPAPAGVTGSSKAALLRGDDEFGDDRAVFCSECTWLAARSIRRGRYKLIHYLWDELYGQPDMALYDLAADPQETENLAEGRPDIRDEMLDELQQWVSQNLERHGYAADPLIDPGVTLSKRWLAQRSCGR